MWGSVPVCTCLSWSEVIEIAVTFPTCLQPKLHTSRSMNFQHSRATGEQMKYKCEECAETLELCLFEHLGKSLVQQVWLSAASPWWEVTETQETRCSPLGFCLEFVAWPLDSVFWDFSSLDYGMESFDKHLSLPEGLDGKLTTLNFGLIP